MKAAGPLPKEEKKKLNKKQKKNAEQIEKCHLQRATGRRGGANKGGRSSNSWSHSTRTEYPVNYDIH